MAAWPVALPARRIRGTGPRAIARGLFDESALRRLVASHTSGEADHAERLWALINLELWQRLQFDGESLG